MKSKTIKKVIRAKIDSWLKSIEDEKIRNLAANNTIVTGGAIASMLLKEPVNDYDIYLRTKEAASALANYYVQRFTIKNKNGIECKIWVEEQEDRVSVIVKSAGIASEEGTEKPYEYFEGRPDGEAEGYISDVMTDPGEIEDVYEETQEKALEEVDPDYRPIFLTTNAITLSNKIQLVLRFFGEAETIHENFDYVHATNYWKSWDNELVLNPKALECLLTKELKYIGSKYPIASIIRLRKFIKRGWTVNAGQIVKILFQVNELDLKSFKVLRDQLTGVDCAYFVQILRELSDKNPEKIESAYLIEIIDRLF